jgi:L-ascorbate metabolism protein UlaG (beta-lactamase superfamily)
MKGMASNRYYQGPSSGHWDGERFFNPGHPSVDRSLADLLRWRLGGTRASWAATETRQVVPATSVSDLSVTLIGHASLLLQMDGHNILVDPVWSARASPLRRLGPRRFNAPGVAFEALPPIGAVLLTHNHYDHLDLATLRRLWRTGRPQVVAPLGNDRVVARSDPDIPVRTLDWGQGAEICPGLEVWLHPANHWSSRGLADRRHALWGGFVIKTRAATLYVAGDTGYGDGTIFRAVRTLYGPPDVAILPIGAYAPRWFLKDQHVDPAEAVRIMQDCGAVQALGVHWGTFALTDEKQDAPPRELRQALAAADIPEARFLAMRPGDCWSR